MSFFEIVFFVFKVLTPSKFEMFSPSAAVAQPFSFRYSRPLFSVLKVLKYRKNALQIGGVLAFCCCGAVVFVSMFEAVFFGTYGP